MSHVTTHVLDTASGRPAAAIAVVLESATGEPIAHGTTDADGRVGDLGPERLSAGTYRLRFATGAYTQQTSEAAFYPEVIITFAIDDSGEHYHVPLLLSPFGYSTYRGS